MKAQNGFGWMFYVMLFLLVGGVAGVPTAWIYANGIQPPEPSNAVAGDASPGATAPWSIDKIDSTNDTGQDVSVVIDDSGVTYISYYDATNKHLKMAKYVSSGGNCGPENDWSCEPVDSSGDAGKYNSIAIDPTTNLPVIAYWVGYDLKLASAWGGGWDIMTVDSGSGGYASLKIDSTGAAHIAYYHSGGVVGLEYARRVGSGTGNCGGNNYQCDTIDGGSGVGQYPSLALDNSGQPRIAYYNGDSDALWYAQPATAGNCGPGNSWGCYQVSSGTDAGRYASLDVDKDNISHIAYYDTTNGKLMYATQVVGSGGNCGPLNSWQCEEITTMGTGSHTRDVSLAVDKAGMPIIAYHRYIWNTVNMEQVPNAPPPSAIISFNVARPAAALGLQIGNCGPQILWWCKVIPDSVHSGDYSAIAVSPSGLATIAYHHAGGDNALMVAYQQLLKVFLPLNMKDQ